MKTGAVIAMLLSSICVLIFATQLKAAEIKIGHTAGRIEVLTVGEAKASFASDKGGFSITDAKSKKEIVLADGKVSQLADKTSFDCEKKGDIKLHAEFAAQKEYILVNGYVESLIGTERGIILDYCIAPEGQDLIFSNDLNNKVKIDGSSEHEGNVYPIAAMSGKKTSVAMAIPPSDPREFGMAGGAKGLITRFYLGVTPKTKKFPNRASFVFIIYPVESQWGFRSALSKYYGFYPEYYETRLKRNGEILVNIRGSTELPDMEHYIDSRVDFTQAEVEFARNKKFGILSHGYMNPGTVELSKLPEKPNNVDEAVALYKKICASDSNRPVDTTAETPEKWTEGDNAGACELIDNSACTLSTGQYAVLIRYTGWGQNTISFKTNPNPYLFDGKKRSIGKKSLLTVQEWMAKYPQLDGVLIDSLGANWPALLNYRQDHFEFAQYPLTCDPDGRPALHNEISYYELLSALRTQLRTKNKFMFGNGVYSYARTTSLSYTKASEPEHYRGLDVTLGRFFIASLLDMATSESGIKAGQDRLEFCRVALCKKPYVLTNAHWTNDDIQMMKNWFNKTLVYGVCGSNTRIYSMTTGPIPYYPEGYNRDKDFIDWYMSKQDLLWKAGWEPLTYASVSGENVLAERFGGKDQIYFVVYSEKKEPQECMLELDLKALGLESGKFLADEVSGQSSLENKGGGKIRLKLAPYKTCIVAITKPKS